MRRSMARQAGAEREKRAKIINAERESLAAARGEASDTMMVHPLALQIRNLQSLVEIGVDKNTTVQRFTPHGRAIAGLFHQGPRPDTHPGSTAPSTALPTGQVLEPVRPTRRELRCLAGTV